MPFGIHYNLVGPILGQLVSSSPTQNS